MPQNAGPLSNAQRQTIRRWIAEGARNDDLHAPSFQIDREHVRVSREKPTRISGRVNTQAYLVVSARDPRNNRILWSEVGSVKQPKEANDAGAPGDLIHWDLRAGTGWPESVTVELSIFYAQGDPRDSELYTREPE